VRRWVAGRRSEAALVPRAGGAACRCRGYAASGAEQNTPGPTGWVLPHAWRTRLVRARTGLAPCKPCFGIFGRARLGLIAVPTGSCEAVDWPCGYTANQPDTDFKSWWTGHVGALPTSLLPTCKDFGPKMWAKCFVSAVLIAQHVITRTQQMARGKHDTQQIVRGKHDEQHSPT